MIIIDTREPYVKITKLFSEIAPYIKVKVHKLDLGDYLISSDKRKELLIERKTISDYTSHLSDLKDKLYRMRAKGLSGLLLEGNYKTTSSVIVERRGAGNYESIPLSSFHNFLFHQQMQGTLLFRTNNIKESVILMSNLHNYLDKVRSPTCPVSSPRPIDMLTFLPGIQEERALRIIERYGPVGNALRKVEEWSNVPGIGAKTVDKINEFLYEIPKRDAPVKKDKKEEFKRDWINLSNQEFRRKYYFGPWSDL